MNRTLAVSLGAVSLAVTIVAAAVPAVAHHSFAMFDSGNVQTLKGTVKEFRWSNPHVALFVAVDGSSSPDKLWAVELTSPGNLKRLGWSRTILKPGDNVEVDINPLRDGRNGGGFRSAKLVDSGQVLTASLLDIERKN